MDESACGLARSKQSSYNDTLHSSSLMCYQTLLSNLVAQLET